MTLIAHWRSFIICPPQQCNLGDKITEDDMVNAWVTYGEEKKYVQDFGGETW